ncbi:MAG: hypothetical protein ISS26_00195 [Candidatus Omnitrophica bacterium]|nr:hypothetical protein [Candidatus Omnitrophota bacterium]
MIDKDLEYKIKKIKVFMELWVKFHDMYKNALSHETITPEEEKNFLETKSLITRKYQALIDYLGIDRPYDDKTFDVISQLLSLKSVVAISDLSLHKIEYDWHNSYVLLNKLLGELDARQESLRKISKFGLFIRELTSNPIANLIIAIVLIIALYMLVTYGEQALKPKEDIESKIEFRQQGK